MRIMSYSVRPVARGAALVLGALLLTVSTASAQYGSGRPGGGFRGGPGAGGRPGIDPSSIPTAEQLAGPPNAVTLRQVVSLDSAQMEAYGSRYQAHMRRTEVERDSAQALLTELRGAMRERDFQGAQRYSSSLRGLSRNLEKEDKEFEKEELKPLLTSDQQKAYEQYLKSRKKAAEEERRDRFGGGGGRRPGGA